MGYEPEEYTRYYIVQALFRLMDEYEYEKIGVKDIAEKAGVGRATFYRYFKRKEDVIEFYFAHNVREFMSEQHYYPRCRADYLSIAKTVFEKFREHKDRFKLLKRAHLEYLYLDFLNKNFAEMFHREFGGENAYAPYLYAGSVFNVSMRWLENDCLESPSELAETMVNAVYFGS